VVVSLQLGGLKFTMFAYRRLQHAIVAKVIEYGVPVIIVDPRNTSSVPPNEQ
jgi:IS605 OrfB family transposase